MIGHYRVLDAIGVGGMGEVYRARDSRLQRDVALKVLPSHLGVDIPTPSRSSGSQLTSLTPAPAHRHGLRVIGRMRHRLLAMELFRGEHARAAHRRKAAYLINDAIAIAIRSPMRCPRRTTQGIVHRDLKPANVMITAMDIKVLDFGLAKAMTADSAVSGRSTQLHSPTAVFLLAMTQLGVILGTVVVHVAGAGARQARRIGEPTCGPSGACSTRCSPARRPSAATIRR